jgi:RNA polymerase sigma-70 factor (ECF subfamily)
MHMTSLDEPVTSRAIAAVSPSSIETELVRRARRGDHEAFRDLVDAKLSSTFRTAMAILGNEADARDATQVAFVKAWTNLPRLREPDHFGAWFGRIVVNTCRSSMRGRRQRTVREVAVSALADGGETLPARTGWREEHSADLDALERAFGRLTSDERVVLWLHHHEDQSLAEMSDVLAVPVTTVKSRLFTARRALQHALEVETR